MKYDVNINGIDVEASYSEEDIRDVYEPLLRRLAEIRREKGSRVLAMIAAPPGAGKSTLASVLEYYAKALLPDLTVQAIGMDGFHRRQEYLTSHETEVDGKMIPMVQIKGAPVTFELEAFTAKIKDVLAGGTVGWPSEAARSICSNSSAVSGTSMTIGISSAADASSATAGQSASSAAMAQAILILM